MARGMNKTKRIALLAMLSALGVVILYIGSLISVMDISMAVLVSLLGVIAVIEYGKGSAFLTFAVTSVLALILLPQKSPALMYVLFFGYYPILKEQFEKQKKLVSWVLKEVVFNVALVIIVIALHKIAFVGADIPLPLYLIGIALCELVFPLYDVALTRLISFYLYSLRRRFNFKK